MAMADALAKIFSASADERVGMPVTFIVDGKGQRHVLSRYGDERIDMSPYVSNPANACSYINLALFPERWRSATLDLLLAFWRYGRPGHAPPKASTVINKSVLLVKIIRWLDNRAVKSFRQIRPLHVSTFAAEHREASSEDYMKPGTLAGALSALSLAWELRDRLDDAMSMPPFGDRGSIGVLANLHKRRDQEVLTKALTDEGAARLFAACEAALQGIEDTLTDYEEIEAYKAADTVGKHSKYGGRDVYWSMPHLYGRWREVEERVNDARAACFTLIGLLVGMRFSEILLLEDRCYVDLEHEGEMLGWLNGRTLKMRPDGSDATRWIAPPLVEELVRVMERISGPMRQRLLRQIAAMEHELETTRLARSRRTKLIGELDAAQRSLRRLFLSAIRSKAGGVPIRGSGRGATYWVRRMVQKAGIDLHVHPHMLRRTFATMVIHQCAGDLRYLRKHFQHWSIETTQLYATHEQREQELVDEIAEEMLTQKVGLVATWLAPKTVLAGRAGEYIALQRSKPEFKGMIESDLKSVARHLADGLVVRPTGHSWCLSSPVMSCGGQGLYDATQCAGCDGAVVTMAQKSIWELLAQQMLEVEGLADTGPAGRQLVERSLAHFDKILVPLGSSVKQVAKKMRAKK
jgi:integrase